MTNSNETNEGSFLDYIIEIAGSVTGWFAEKAIYYYEQCKDIASGVVSTIMDEAEEFIEWVKVISGEVTQDLSDYQIEVVGWIHDAVWTAIEYTTTQSNSFALRVRQMLSDIINWSMDKGSALYNKIREIVLEIGGDIAAKTREFAAIIDSLSDVVSDYVKKGIAHITNALDFPEQILASIAEISEDRWYEVGAYFTKLLGRILLFATKDIELKEPGSA